MNLWLARVSAQYKRRHWHDPYKHLSAISILSHGGGLKLKCMHWQFGTEERLAPETLSLVDPASTHTHPPLLFVSYLLSSPPILSLYSSTLPPLTSTVFNCINQHTYHKEWPCLHLISSSLIEMFMTWKPRTQRVMTGGSPVRLMNERCYGETLRNTAPRASLTKLLHCDTFCTLKWEDK